MKLLLSLPSNPEKWKIAGIFNFLGHLKMQRIFYKSLKLMGEKLHATPITCEFFSNERERKILGAPHLCRGMVYISNKYWWSMWRGFTNFKVVVLQHLRNLFLCQRMWLGNIVCIIIEWMPVGPGLGFKRVPIQIRENHRVILF